MTDIASPGAIGRTRGAIGKALRRRDARAVFASVTAGYLLAYLYAIGHLIPDADGIGVTVARDPLARVFQSSYGLVSFEPIASVELGAVTYFASLNTALGLGLAALVGLNLALTYLAWTQPRACGIGSQSAGLLAGVPALLSGAACCGPVLLVVLGVQATGLVLTTFEFLVPIAAGLLVLGLVLVGRQVDPALL